MFSEFLQFLISGVTVGATYALVALGFSIIYNSSNVINFAQGEFVMLGGMSTVFLLSAGFPLPLAILCAIAITVVIGLLVEKLAIEPAREGSVVTLIIITIGASIFLRGATQIAIDKEFHSLPAFSGEEPIMIGGASMLPQSLWIVGGAFVMVLLMWFFFDHMKLGKAMLAMSYNRLAARLVGINVRMVLTLSFVQAALLGAIGGILVAPMSVTYYEVGIMLGLKGFCAAILGGLGRGWGAVLGGLIVGVAEAMGAGYISSDYKDAIAFIIILLVLFFMPSGLLGKRSTERV
ncbi:MAG: branched-chain amino acid ABC transporter permease [Rhodospirillales bacterium]|nr:branched-chain amino acid ABC transporter permease [Rhodospirillales bacterium]